MDNPKRRQDFAPRIPQGMQVFFGDEVHRRRAAESLTAGIMKNWGFQEIILPFFDYLDSFSYGLGTDLSDQAFRFLDKDGSLLALRPDLTTLVAKTVATRMTGQRLPIKLFYSGAVFRQAREGAGQQKELYQIGLESMGEGSLWADIEVLLLAVDCLLRLGIEGFKFAVGHVGFFNGILQGLNLSAERAAALREAIDHKDSAWLRQEVSGLRVSEGKKKFLADVPQFAGGREVLDHALEIVENQKSRRALGELAEICGVFEELGLEQVLSFDLAEVRGLDYYTGIVFKIYGRSLGFELGGGGRYDGLPGNFGWDIPAVGFSFTLDRILPLLVSGFGLQETSGGDPELAIATEHVSMKDLFREVWEQRSRGKGIRLGRKL